MKKTMAILLSTVMAASLAACGGSSSGSTTAAETTAASTTTAAAAETTAASTTAEAEESKAESTAASSGKTYQIGVLQYVQHPALDKSNEGFVAALDDAGISYEIDQQNASGDQSACQTIATTLVNDKKDLILAIATPAAQAVAGQTSEIPILITAVTDPAASKLVASNDAPGGNVTGTSDLTPVKEQIDLLTEILPDAKKVGILYCSAESNSIIQKDMAIAECEAKGLETLEMPITASNEIQTVMESAISKGIDSMYVPTDNMAAAGMTTIAMIANDNKIPVICGEDGEVQSGGLCTYGIDYYELGYLCGQQAVKILVDGADTATMPIEYLPAEKCEFSYNEETAKALGIDLSSYAKS